jgi:thioredoxin reductase (NADPH)
MSKPVILSVDDDPDVLAVVARDLRSRYGDRYRVIAVDSGTAALDVLRKLKLRTEVVALMLVDQLMPAISGVDFLEQATPFYGNAKRVLLTAYADTNAAIRAINDVKIHHYLVKPWSPPEQKLYPALDDLLADWESSYQAPFEGLRLIGHRWSPKTHELKDFLARNQIPYCWLDIETDPNAQRLLEHAGAEITKLPVALFADGSHCETPTPLIVARRVGLKTEAQSRFYDLIIVGGGPAGLAAAVYGASEGLRTVIIEREAPGGQAGTSSRIENYLGFPVGLSGTELTRRAIAQAHKFGAEILTPVEAVGLRTESPYRALTLSDGSELKCFSMLISTGVTYNLLRVEGIERLTGAGIYYGAAMTEAIACRDEVVYIVGAGNSAGQAAMYLSGYAHAVHLIVRGDSLKRSMSSYLIDQVTATSNIKVHLETEVSAALGEERLEALRLKTGQGERTVSANALFIFVGAQPRTDWLRHVIDLDENGFIFTGNDCKGWRPCPRNWIPARSPFLLETSVPGVFAAGDVRHQSVKRVASSVGEGSIAVQFVHQHLACL